jgi:hypothetical protein
MVRYTLFLCSDGTEQLIPAALMVPWYLNKDRNHGLK